MSSAEAYPSPPPGPEASKVDPILRNALRYTISAKEYKILHEYLITRSPRAFRKRAPPPARVDSITGPRNDHNAAAIRASLRVFIASQTVLQAWDLIRTRFLTSGKTQQSVCLKGPEDERTQTVQYQRQDVNPSISQSPPIPVAFPHPFPPSSPLSLLYPASIKSSIERCRSLSSTQPTGCEISHLSTGSSSRC